MNIDREIARKSLYYLEGNLPDGPNDQFEFERHKALLKMISTQEAHSDDGWIALFGAAMKVKMAAARAKERRGWEGADPANISKALREHVDKGDPIDVANFCMMLWALQERIGYVHPIAEVTALRERIAGMEKDAERYRYLRNCGVIVDFTRSGPWKFTDDVDAAIDKYLERKAERDAAIAKEPK